MSGLNFISEIFRKFPFSCMINILLLVVVSLIGIASIFSVAPVIDFLINSDAGEVSSITQQAMSILKFMGLPATLNSFLAVFLVFQVLGSGFAIFAQYSSIKIKYAVIRDLEVGVFEAFFSARWSFFGSQRQGTLLNTFNREAVVVGEAFGATTNFFASFVQLVFYLSVPFYISWQVTSISLTTALFFALPFLLFGKLNYSLGKQNTSTGNEMNAILQESLGSAKVILGFGNQQKTIDNYKLAFDAHCRAALKSQTLGVAMPFMYQPLSLLVVVIALFVAQKLTISLSEMAVLLWALRQSVPGVGRIVAQRNSLKNFLPSYEQMRNLQDEAVRLRQRSGERLFTGFDGEIAVEDLSFAYPGHEPTLIDINLRIPKGAMIALVGASGAGKSTLIDMILGFNEPLEGRISFDGVPLEYFDIHSYRQRIGYVPQESILFNMTIRDNLCWAKEDATNDEIEAACRQANADEFIREFPDGYDTLVGDRGIRLSGGQCQRIALARAILRKPELLILDEATSSLDTHSERLIQGAIESIAEEATVIVIAHRLSTVVNADYLYVLEKGRIVEEGTYQTLVSRPGHFSRMTQLQLLETTDF